MTMYPEMKGWTAVFHLFDVGRSRTPHPTYLSSTNFMSLEVNSPPIPLSFLRLCVPILFFEK